MLLIRCSLPSVVIVVCTGVGLPCALLCYYGFVLGRLTWSIPLSCLVDACMFVMGSTHPGIPGRFSRHVDWSRRFGRIVVGYYEGVLKLI